MTTPCPGLTALIGLRSVAFDVPAGLKRRREQEADERRARAEIRALEPWAASDTLARTILKGYLRQGYMPSDWPDAHTAGRYAHYLDAARAAARAATPLWRPPASTVPLVGLFD